MGSFKVILIFENACNLSKDLRKLSQSHTGLYEPVTEMLDLRQDRHLYCPILSCPVLADRHVEIHINQLLGTEDWGRDQVHNYVITKKGA